MFEIGWVDYSREERNKILNIIKLLGEQTALDELGIGVVRDAFSDLLFPGISTLQTRAKYYVLIPYIFREAELRSFNSSKDVLNFIRKSEDKLVSVLVENSPGAEGIIGSRSYKNGKTVKMKPSIIYWSGLRATGILRYQNVSIDSVCRQIVARNSKANSITLKISDNDTAQDDTDALRQGNTIFTPIVPTYDFMKDATINLTQEESAYLKRQFTTAKQTKSSLMSYMLQNNAMFPSFSDIPSNALDEPLATYVRLAQNFADFIYGAHLLYNIILAEGCNHTDTDIEDIKEEFTLWSDNYISPPLDEIIATTKCSDTTATFLRNFNIAIQNGNIEKAKDIIIARERIVKPNRQKLNRPNYYSYEKPIHWYKLDFRYSTAKRIAEDILNAEKEDSK